MSETEDFNISGLIKSKEASSGEKDGKAWTRYAFVVKQNNGSKDVTMSTFSKDLAEAWNAGDSVQCQYRFDGKYNTLVGFEEGDMAPEVVNHGESNTVNNTVNESPKELSHEEKKQKVIVRQNVLNRAVELHLAGKIEENKILEKAEELEEWVWKA
jgi:hypothetical protein